MEQAYNMRGERVNKSSKTLCGVPCTYSTQPGGAHPLEKNNQLSDVECSDHRREAWPGPRHESRFTDGHLPYPVAEHSRNRHRPPKNSMPVKVFQMFSMQTDVPSSDASSVG